MKPETADRLATALDRAAMQVSGGSDLKTSVADITRLLETLLVHLKRCDSAETVRQSLLSMDEPSRKTVKLIEGTLRFAPRITFDRLKRQARKFLAAQTTTGRPTSIPVEAYLRVCAEISALEFQGDSLAQAERKIAKVYGVDKRTTHRIWSNRGQYPRDGVTLKHHGVQFGAGIVAAGISIFGSPTDGGLSATGVGLSLAEKSATNIAVHGTELIPIVGNVVSAGATLHDIFGSEGLIANYKGCMAGTHP